MKNKIKKMETINLNKYEAFNFDFSIIERLNDIRDRYTYKSKKEIEIFITSDTKFNINVSKNDLPLFEDIMDLFSSGKQIRAIDYKKKYIYTHDTFILEAYGAFPVTIDYPELGRRSNVEIFGVELQSDYIKLKIKDLKGFLKHFNIHLRIIKRIIKKMA